MGEIMEATATGLSLFSGFSSCALISFAERSVWVTLSLMGSIGQKAADKGSAVPAMQDTP